MILQGNQRINIVVRGLIFKDNQLLVTQWKNNSESFPIGGRVEFGEPLIEALRREVREETGAEISIKKLVYFGEHVFINNKGIQHHEYGWYFLVEPDRHICGLDEIIPNPDTDKLIIRYLPVNAESLQNFWPRFLRPYLPGDLAQGFSQNPRYLYALNQDEMGRVQIRETEEFYL
jgi:ADP-ribose pyrophosphatase YjhB (NUDIX family)